MTKTKAAGMKPARRNQTAGSITRKKPVKSSRKTPKRDAGRRGVWVGAGAFAFAFWVLPHLLVHYSGLPEWRGRAVYLGIFASVLPAVVLYWSLHPRSDVLPNEAKWKKSPLAKKSEWALRGIGVLFGCAFLYAWTLPYCLDVFEIRGGTAPLRITGSVTRVSHSRASSTVTLLRDAPPKGERPVAHYTFFTLSPPKEGEPVALLALPRTHLALDWQPKHPTQPLH
jgi:hypothetical protein